MDLATTLGPVIPVNVRNESVVARVAELTDKWGADIVFEASGSQAAADHLFEMLNPGGTVVYIGMPESPVLLDIVSAQAKEATIRTIFRYANVYTRAVNLLGSGMIDLKPLLTDSFGFEDSIAAYEYALNPKSTSVKVQILM